MNPKLSIIVNFHNMRREAERTLFTLSNMYQRNLSPLEYEVIAIDNGSTERLDPHFVKQFGDNFNYFYFEPCSLSPAKAINYGVSVSKGDYISCIVDGARMVTPCIVFYCLKSIQTFKSPFVSTAAFHLGADIQNNSMLKGYNQHEEDKLLETVNWKNDGYQLFNISVLAQSSSMGFLGGLPYECSFFMIKKSSFKDLNGFNENFESPGGGFVNHDFLLRVVESNQFDYVTLLGEGTFHQYHGGVATNVPLSKHPLDQFMDEYLRLSGKPYRSFKQPLVHYLGSIPKPAIQFVHNQAT